VLAGGQGTLASQRPLKTVGSYWPYATTLWDYINRAMPFERPRSMSADETYAVTAYVLFLNAIVTEQQVVSQTTLPQIVMPNRSGFVPDARPDAQTQKPQNR
jgi:cytochrome c